MKRLFALISALLCCLPMISQTTQLDRQSGNAETLYPFRSGVTGSVGFIDRNGRIVIPANHTQLRNGRPYLREDESVHILRDYMLGEPFSEGFTPTEKDGKYGYIDLEGRPAIQFQFYQAAHFSHGLAAARKGDFCGYINSSGAYAIPRKYKECAGFSEGLAAVKDENSNSVIDVKGTIVFRSKYDEIGPFSEGMALVKSNGVYGYVGKDGRELIRPQFVQAGRFSEGLAGVSIGTDAKDEKFGFVDKAGKWVIQPQFQRAGRFSEGVAVVAISNGAGFRYGYIDRTGKFVIEPKFPEAKNFSEGTAVVGEPFKYGYIDKYGKPLFNQTFRDALDFHNGLAVVQRGITYGGTIGGCTETKAPLDGLGPRKPGNSCRNQRLFIDYAYIDHSGRQIFTGSFPVAHKNVGADPLDVDEYGDPPLVTVDIDTQPQGAKVYLIPLLMWEHEHWDDNSKEKKLDQYLQTSYTPSSWTIFQDVYIVLVELNGSRKHRQKDFNQYQERIVLINFKE